MKLLLHGETQEKKLINPFFTGWKIKVKGKKKLA